MARQRPLPVRPRARAAVALWAPMSFRSARDRGDIRVDHGQALDIQHRLRQSGARERIADVVHVAKAADMGAAVRRRPGAAQFAQGVRTEGREGEKPSGASTRRISRSAASRSSHHCSIRLLNIRLTAPSRKGSWKTSPQTRCRGRSQPLRRRVSRSMPEAPDPVRSPARRGSGPSAGGRPRRCRSPDPRPPQASMRIRSRRDSSSSRTRVCSTAAAS